MKDKIQDCRLLRCGKMSLKKYGTGRSGGMPSKDTWTCSLRKLTVGLERPGWHDNRGGLVIDFEKRRTCWYVVSLCAALRRQPNCVCDPLAECWLLLGQCVGSVLVDD